MKTSFRAKTGILITLVLLVFGSWAFAADSTSFDPRPIKVTSASQGGVPIGAVVEWPHANLPAEFDRAGNPKWLECNGQGINAAVYPELAAMYGARVPDDRGLFKRGAGGKAAPLGQVQEEGVYIAPGMAQVEGIVVRHYFTDPLHPVPFGLGNYQALFPGSAGVYSYTEDGRNIPIEQIPIPDFGVNTGATETRPSNVATRYLMRALP
jgi:hypothetical protein